MHKSMDVKMLIVQDLSKTKIGSEEMVQRRATKSIHHRWHMTYENKASS